MQRRSGRGVIRTGKTIKEYETWELFLGIKKHGSYFKGGKKDMPSHLDHGGEHVFHSEVEVAAIVVELSNPNTALKERNLFRYARGKLLLQVILVGRNVGFPLHSQLLRGDHFLVNVSVPVGRREERYAGIPRDETSRLRGRGAGISVCVLRSSELRVRVLCFESHGLQSHSLLTSVFRKYTRVEMDYIVVAVQDRRYMAKFEPFRLQSAGLAGEIVRKISSSSLDRGEHIPFVEGGKYTNSKAQVFELGAVLLWSVGKEIPIVA